MAYLDNKPLKSADYNKTLIDNISSFNDSKTRITGGIKNDYTKAFNDPKTQIRIQPSIPDNYSDNTSARSDLGLFTSQVVRPQPRPVEQSRFQPYPQFPVKQPQPQPQPQLQPYPQLPSADINDQAYQAKIAQAEAYKAMTPEQIEAEREKKLQSSGLYPRPLLPVRQFPPQPQPQPIRPEQPVSSMPPSQPIEYATQEEANTYAQKRNEAMHLAGFAEINSSGPEGQKLWAERNRWVADYEMKNPRPKVAPVKPRPLPRPLPPVRKDAYRWKKGPKLPTGEMWRRKKKYEKSGIPMVDYKGGKI